MFNYDLHICIFVILLCHFSRLHRGVLEGLKMSKKDSGSKVGLLSTLWLRVDLLMRRLWLVVKASSTQPMRGPSLSSGVWFVMTAPRVQGKHLLKQLVHLRLPNHQRTFV